MPGYDFTDEWRVAADPAAVWDVVRHVELWPDWWPSAQSVTEVGSPGTGGEVWRFVFRTRLPYPMGFDARVLRDDPLHGVETSVTGRVEGRGRWQVTTVAGGAAVGFDWVVSPQVAWMRVLSPVARPLFVWNHRALMREGGEALARRLDTRLLVPPSSTPALAPAIAAAAAWPAGGLAVLAGLRMLLRRPDPADGRPPARRLTHPRPTAEPPLVPLGGPGARGRPARGRPVTPGRRAG